ncbi:MAG: hypothetical protein IKT14_06980 [Clostridiales bacterium]|nr:hypothetical protein [Clostridiales bacterium]
MAKRKPVAWIIVIVGVITAVSSVISADKITFHLYEGDEMMTFGILSALLLFAFDYSFAVGFRSGVLGYSLADVTFHMAGPFTKRFNLLLSFEYGLSSILVFFWILCVNMPFFSMWTGLGTKDALVFLLFALTVSAVIFPLTSYVSARFSSGMKARLIPVLVLIALHFLGAFLFIRDLIGKYGSFENVKSLKSNVIFGELGQSRILRSFPVAGQFITLMEKALKGDLMFVPVLAAVLVVYGAVLILLYRKTKFDYYEDAYSNAQKIADIIEASKAGVEAVNTGISRTATVGNEKFDKGWGASAFFHMHLFENRRTSKLFFVNKVALVYRAFALLILFMVDGVVPDDLEAVVVLTGVVTMLVLNAIVFGGGKTVLEFNRPYIFLVPESSVKKLAMCLTADIPEMAFDALICTVMIKIVAFHEFTWFPMISFIILMITFDLLSSATGLLCVRLLGGFGKFAVMFVRYMAILALIVIGMIPSNIMAGLLVAVIADSMATALGIIILSMAAVYFLIWIAMIFLSRNILEKIDAF